VGRDRLETDALILNRYVILEILKPLTAMLAVVMGIFAAYSSARYLSDAAYGLVPMGTVAALILLKVVISLEVLLPTTLYLSVIVGLGRMYKDGEITALFSAGIGVKRIMGIVFVLSLAAALAVAGLSLYVRPQAYAQMFRLKAKAKAEFDITRFKAGKFYNLGKGKKTIFIERIDHRKNRAEGVFLLNDDNGILRVVTAKGALREIERDMPRQGLLFLDGRAYEFPRTGRGVARSMRFNHLSLSLWPKEIPPLEYKIKAASTMHLVRSSVPLDIAECQWRFSAPLSTILLALLGVPLSRTTEREGKYARVATAVLIFIIYYFIAALAKIFVERGLVPAFPGIWWTQGLLAVLMILLVLQPSMQFRSAAGPAR